MRSRRRRGLDRWPGTRRPSGHGRRGARDVDDQRAAIVTLDEPGRDERDGRNEEGRQGPQETHRDHGRDERGGDLELGRVLGSQELRNDRTNVNTPASGLTRWCQATKSPHHPNTQLRSRSVSRVRAVPGAWRRHDRGRYSVVAPSAKAGSGKVVCRFSGRLTYMICPPLRGGSLDRTCWNVHTSRSNCTGFPAKPVQDLCARRQRRVRLVAWRTSCARSRHPRLPRCSM